MRYDIAELIDLDEFRKLMESFYNITKIPFVLLDINENIIIGYGMQKICMKFHRVNPKCALRCKESDLSVKNRINANEEFGIYVCKNGLVEAFTPIIVEGEHLATLFLGQFFFSEPDIDYFVKQADEFGFDLDEYLEVLSQVPIVSRQEIESYMHYYFQLAKMLSRIGLDKLKKNETEKLLLKQNELLENMVMERTSKLYEINKNLKDHILRRKSVEAELKERKERYKNLIELLPCGVCVYAKDTILFSNKTAATYFGIVNPQDMIGKKATDLFIPQPEYKMDYEKNMVRLLKTGYIELTEEKLIRKFDGKDLDVEATYSLIQYNGETAIMAVFRDISERILLKEKIELDNLRTEFFSNLSHEFKTPLNLIYSTIQLFEAELYKKDMEKDKINKRLEIMKQNCNRMSRLINNLIDISKIEAGYFELVMQNLNIVRIVEEITLSLAEYMENKKIKLIFDTDIEEKIITVDPYAMERVLLNLLSNAVKFSKPGDKIMVNIYEKNENILISIRDTGIGMRQDKLESIFDRFKQIDKSFSRDKEGSGIGLSIVKEIVNMHGGEISVNSEYKVGSEFIIKLPVKQLDIKANIIKDTTCNYDKGILMEMAGIEFADIYS